MRPWLVMTMIALTAFSVSCKKSDEPGSTASAQATATEEAEFSVEGMHCATCPVTVKAAARGVTGVSSVRVSMDEAKAWVSFDPARTTPEAIASAITESGYKATPRGSTP